MNSPDKSPLPQGKSSATSPSSSSSSAASPSQQVPAGKYYALLVTMLVLLSALGSFVNDMFSPALPGMCRFFRCSVPTVQMGLTSGMIGLALGQLILGPVSDRIGRKPVMIGALLLFIVAAVVSVFSPTIEFFIWCRLFQGIGAAGGYFLARTIPADIFAGRPLARLMALVGAINGFAPASAPVIGGVTADAFGWKGIFVVLAIFAAILLIMSPFLKESLPLSRRTKGPWYSFIYGYAALLRNKAFILHVCFKGMALGLLFAYISSSPFIIQNHYGFSQTGYGLLVGLNSVFAAIGSMLALKFKPLKQASQAGAWIVCAGVVGEALSLWFVHSLWVYEIFMITIIFGLGMIFTTANTLAMNEGRHSAGEASSLLGISGYIVGAIVSPLVGLGNILHSTAIVFVVLAVLIFLLSLMLRRVAPDLNS